MGLGIWPGGCGRWVGRLSFCGAPPRGVGEVVGSGEAVSIEVFGHVPPDGSADRCVVGDVGGVK